MAKIRVDKHGQFYVPMSRQVQDSLPDEMTLTVRGETIHYMLDPRIYLPNDDQDNALLDTVIGVRYVTPAFMAEHLEDLIEGEDEKT